MGFLDDGEASPCVVHTVLSYCDDSTTAGGTPSPTATDSPHSPPTADLPLSEEGAGLITEEGAGLPMEEDSLGSDLDDSLLVGRASQSSTRHLEAECQSGVMSSGRDVFDGDSVGVWAQPDSGSKQAADSRRCNPSHWEKGDKEEEEEEEEEGGSLGIPRRQYKVRSTSAISRPYNFSIVPKQFARSRTAPGKRMVSKVKKSKESMHQSAPVVWGKSDGAMDVFRYQASQEVEGGCREEGGGGGGTTRSKLDTSRSSRSREEQVGCTTRSHVFCNNCFRVGLQTGHYVR